MQFDVASEPVCWERQAEFLDAMDHIVVLLTGAGYGKTKILVDKTIRNVCAQDNWHLNYPGAVSDHLKYIYAAPHDKYLTARSIPAMKAQCDYVEATAGHRIRARTGRSRDGFFGGGSDRRQEFRNGVDVLFYPLYDSNSAVSVDAAGVSVDEATLLSHPDIWLRLNMRLRDPRALFHQVCAVGTPEEDHFIRDLLADEEGNARKGIKIITASSIENPILPMTYFEQMGQQASPAFIKAQVMGGWVSGLGGQRFGNVFDMSMVGGMPLSRNDPRAQFYLGWDPGYNTGAVVVFFHNRPKREWWVYDEFAVTGQTTRSLCKKIQERGYTTKNIAGIGIDFDSRKMRSSAAHSKDNDFNVIYDAFGIRPRYLYNRHIFNKDLRTRLDVLERLMVQKRLLFNRDLMPRSTKSLGVINSIRNFALKKIDDTEFFQDVPTPESERLWKHFIDAMHYALVQFEEGEYKRVRPGESRKRA